MRIHHPVPLVGEPLPGLRGHNGSACSDIRKADRAAVSSAVANAAGGAVHGKGVVPVATAAGSAMQIDAADAALREDKVPLPTGSVFGVKPVGSDIIAVTARSVTDLIGTKVSLSCQRNDSSIRSSVTTRRTIDPGLWPQLGRSSP